VVSNNEPVMQLDGASFYEESGIFLELLSL